MSLDYLNKKDSKLKAFGGFIFTGSASLGIMSAGYNLDRILEISDDIVRENAYHFVKNFSSIPVVTPSVWEDEKYLESLKNENYDLGFFNCPCSSLSQINRNASLDGDKNVHFYRVFNMIDKIEPKVFFIENAPTLVKLGYPIIQDMTKKLGDKYKFTIVRDYAGNHGVPMKRMRTLVVGWKKDVFDNKIPLLQMNHVKSPTVKDTIGDLYSNELDSILNHNLVRNRTSQDIEDLISFSITNKTINESIISQWNVLEAKVKGRKSYDTLAKIKDKIDNNKRYWDKSPYKVSEDGVFPSLTSVTEILHPTLNRQLTIREYARIMGYPDDFVFYEECKTPVIQCIAQGVPANFVKYVGEEVKEALANNRSFDPDSSEKILCFQHHTSKKYNLFSPEELELLTGLEATKSFKNLTK